LTQLRREALQWWRGQHFGQAVPTRTFANAMLTTLVDNALHPDPWVAEMLPRVLERLFGVQISVKAFMWRLLPKFGGFVDATGVEVPIGCGLALLSNLPKAAETILVFIRQWADLVSAAEEEEAQQKRKGGMSQRSSLLDVKRGSMWHPAAFMDRIMDTGHDSADVEELLEGARQIPEHVLTVPSLDRLYNISDERRRMWELMTWQDLDDTDLLERWHRDLGPYIDLRLDDSASLAAAWDQRSCDTWCLVNQEVTKTGAIGWQRFKDNEGDSDDDAANDRGEFDAWVSRPRKIHLQSDVSNVFSIKLVDYPKSWGTSDSSSTFIRFFSEEGRQISRKCLQGLPPLPWSFGKDPRNAIIMDTPGIGVAPLHCIFKQAATQPGLACIIPLGEPTTPSHIVCPKYQPLQIRNGDRLICEQWRLELQIRPAGNLSSLTILTDEGGKYEVPHEGCHMGAGTSSRRLAYQPIFPDAKFVFNHRLSRLASVHVAFYYHTPMNRWTLVDHSPNPFGTMLLLRTGMAYPLSVGLRIKMGDVVVEVGEDCDN